MLEKEESMLPAFQLALPLSSGGEFAYTLQAGGVLFLLGANGTGKSSLITRFYGSNSIKARRISAHRQTWFSSNSLDMTPSARETTEQNIRNQDSNARSRHVLPYASERTAIAIFDLIDSDTMLARKIAELVRSKDIPGAEKAAATPAPIALINQIMRSSNIPIEIEVEERQKVVAKKNGGAPYSVAELSDGERNAFLIAADVLTAKPGTLLLIDEPERHLHRSIISPLLSLLFQQRKDCAFVISTHEIMMPIDNPTAATLLVRSCDYEGATAKSWSVDLLSPDAPLDETLKLDILGGRQKMIFIEGTTQSLDAPIYSLLFPQVSIIPKASCRDVEYAVRGLREAETKHWVKAWGIVDNDRRDPKEIEKLKQFGIFALPHFSVEALYYHPKIIEKVAGRAAALVGKDAVILLKAATGSAIAEAAKQRNHFVVDAVERLTRRAVFEKLPKKTDIKAADQVKIEIDVAALRAAEEVEFDSFIKASDLGELLRRYPLRECGALGSIASALGFKVRTDYENAVRVMLQDDADALSFLRGLFGELVTEVIPPQVVSSSAETDNVDAVAAQ